MEPINQNLNRGKMFVGLQIVNLQTESVNECFFHNKSIQRVILRMYRQIMPRGIDRKGHGSFDNNVNETNPNEVGQ